MRYTETRDENNNPRKVACWYIDEEANVRVMYLGLLYDFGPGGVRRFDAKHPMPDLADVRRDFPEHVDLWNQIRRERLRIVTDTCELPALTPGPPPVLPSPPVGWVPGTSCRAVGGTR
jgi:hypothetical protein